MKAAVRGDLAYIHHDAGLHTLMPHAGVVTAQGHPLLAIPHREQETLLLRNHGYEVPAPVLTQYRWPTNPPPFDSQKHTAAMLTMSRRAYVLSTMGCGKTRAALFAADHLMNAGAIRRALIVAPLSTLTPTWMNEIFTSFHWRSSVVVHGTRKRRVKLLGEDHDFYVINHDGVNTVLDELKLRPDFDLIILDELAVYRQQGTDRWKGAQKLLERRKYAWGLTGAPTPNAPTDAYAQIRLLRPDSVSTWKRFRDDTMWQQSQFKWLPRRGANDYVHSVMQPAVRYKLEDCVDIPETTYVTREVQPSRIQELFYKKMNTAMQAKWREHTIDAANEGVLLGKLTQIACGYVYTDDRKVLDLSPASKLAELDAILSETERKVIVFVPFHHALHAVAKHISKSATVRLIHGQVAKSKRDEIFYQFQHGDKPRVIVAHPATMSHGLTMTAANTIVWYCPTDSLDTYIQANARIARPGQKHKTNIIHLQCTKVENRIYKRLQRQETNQGLLLEMFEEQTMKLTGTLG
jgi:SNF2 family DNA or RNA helicase